MMCLLLLVVVSLELAMVERSVESNVVGKSQSHHNGKVQAGAQYFSLQIVFYRTMKTNHVLWLWLVELSSLLSGLVHKNPEAKLE